ncbi:MAG: CocE/NonD family hydrolase [Hymenobacter sp.]
MRLFVMGGGSGRKTELGKLDHGGRWREEHEWPLARTRPTTLHLHGDGSLRTEPAPAEAEPRRFTYDPDDPVPTIGGLFCAVGELPSGEGEIEPMWARLLNPALLLRNIMTPGPADQKESADFFTAREPYQRLSERPDVLVYRTEPLQEPLEVTGRVAVELWIASSATDTDFTAKLVDVYPPNEDYPEGYDLLLNDTIVRTRFRDGFDHEVFMEPETPYKVTMLLPPTSNLFGRGHRIRIDVSSSNFPRLERNPNTGEPIGRHTHHVDREADGVRRRGAPVPRGSSGDSVTVDGNRLRVLTLELVACKSPTGDTADVAKLYAGRLKELGLKVELLDEPFPLTPIVVGRLKGDRPGPTIVLNGHLDTVPIPHETPRVEGETIHGRGSADMKGALACAAEAVRVASERGSFPGELVIVAIGLHEAPGGRGEDLNWLLHEAGFTADYAVVCELAGDSFAVAHMGSATVAIEISRPGMPTHELQTPKGTPHPLLAAGKVIAAIEARNAELAETEHPWVGAETYFLGELHGGDFYNRFPTTCRLVGTRRWPPGRPLAEVEEEFRALLRADRRADRLHDRARPQARARQLPHRSRGEARGRAPRRPTAR